MAAGLPATPILEHVRNDLALLLAEDLAEALAQPPAPRALGSRDAAGPPGNANFLDTMLGLWVHAREITRSIESVGRLAAEPAPLFEGTPGEGASPALLR